MFGCMARWWLFCTARISSRLVLGLFFSWQPKGWGASSTQVWITLSHRHETRALSGTTFSMTLASRESVLTVRWTEAILFTVETRVKAWTSLTTGCTKVFTWNVRNTGIWFHIGWVDGFWFGCLFWFQSMNGHVGQDELLFGKTEQVSTVTIEQLTRQHHHFSSLTAV